MCERGMECPAVPVTIVTAQVKYCWYHQAWNVSVWRQDQDADEELLCSFDRSMGLGPFDSVNEALNYLVGWTEMALYQPGSPWVRGQIERQGATDYP